MGLTGVIYALVVLAWAAYLLPQALRRHDEAARKHSIERFSSAMRVLARRGPSRSERMVVTPARTADRLLTPSLSPGMPSHEQPDRELRPRPSRAALKAAAERRRRVLLVLVGLTVVTTIVSLFRLVPLWSAAIPVATIVAFLALARRQVRLASDAYWDEVSNFRPEPSNVSPRPAARVDATHGAVRQARATNLERDTADDEPTVTLDAGALREAHVDVGVVATADGGSLWDPLPVTLPTYVDKSVAKRTHRTITLGEPGTWSSGHSAEASETVAGAAASPSTAEPVGGSVDATPRVANG